MRLRSFRCVFSTSSPSPRRLTRALKCCGFRDRRFLTRRQLPVRAHGRVNRLASIISIGRIERCEKKPSLCITMRASFILYLPKHNIESIQQFRERKRNKEREREREREREKREREEASERHPENLRFGSGMETRDFGCSEIDETSKGTLDITRRPNSFGFVHFSTAPAVLVLEGLSRSPLGELARQNSRCSRRDNELHAAPYVPRCQAVYRCRTGVKTSPAY